MPCFYLIEHSYFLQSAEQAAVMAAQLKSAMAEVVEKAEGSAVSLSGMPDPAPLGYFSELLLRATAYLIADLTRHEELLSALVYVPVKTCIELDCTLEFRCSSVFFTWILCARVFSVGSGL